MARPYLKLKYNAPQFYCSECGFIIDPGQNKKMPHNPSWRVRAALESGLLLRVGVTKPEQSKPAVIDAKTGDKLRELTRGIIAAAEAGTDDLLTKSGLPQLSVLKHRAEQCGIDVELITAEIRDELYFEVVNKVEN